MKTRPLKKTILWASLNDGGYHPFAVRTRKSEILHCVGRWDELTAMLTGDLELAGLHGLPGEQARCLLKLGVLDAQRGKFRDARAKAEQALKHYVSAGNKEEVFFCRSILLKIDMNLEQFYKAESTACELLELACQEQNMRKQSDMLNNLGLICLKTGRWQEALDYLNRKMEISEKTGDQRGRASVMGNIGGVYYANRQYEKASEFDRKSIEISRRIGDIYSEYYALYNLAKAHEMMGRNGEALVYYQQDLEIARQLGDGPGEKVICEDLKRLGKGNDKTNAVYAES